MTQEQIISPNIRPYQLRDYDECVSLFTSNIPKYFAASELPEFEQFLLTPNDQFLVAAVGEEIVGCGGYYTKGATGHLCWGMVHQDKHRSSIGSALLRKRLELLFAQNELTHVEISTSQHSAGFFERFGFKSVDVVPNGFGPGIDQVSMILKNAIQPKLSEKL